MKRLSIVVIAFVIVVVFGVAAFTAAPVNIVYVVRDHQTTTQLLWNSGQAYLIAGVRRDGWSGSQANYIWQIIRGAFGGPFQFSESRTWVTVAQIVKGEVKKSVDDSATFHVMRPFDGEIYTQSGPVRKWNGREFERVSEAEATRYKAKQSDGEVSYSDVDGWSSRINLLNRGKGRFEYPLDLYGGKAVVISDTSNAPYATLKVEIAGRGSVDVFAVDESFRSVSADEYATLMRGPLAQ